MHENGLISFGSSLKDQTPSAFPLSGKAHAAAPYWADVFTERGGRVWYRITTEEDIISRATRDVMRAFPRYTRFNANWVVIVTWNEVTFYGASGSHTQNVSYGFLAKELHVNVPCAVSKQVGAPISKYRESVLRKDRKFNNRIQFWGTLSSRKTGVMAHVELCHRRDYKVLAQYVVQKWRNLSKCSS